MERKNRFTDLSEEEIDHLRENRLRENTKRVVRLSVNTFKEFLMQKDKSVEFDKASDQELDELLSSFFANLRTTKGELYKVSSLQSIKFGLWRHFKDSGKDIDGGGFSKWQETFKAAKVRSSRGGKGGVEHKPPISKADIKQLYNSSHHSFDNETPQGLQQKVFFEVMLHLCRRGRENLRGMTKSTFMVKTEAGNTYVTPAHSEEDKNPGEDMGFDDTTGEGRMYADDGNENCPVNSYLKYVSKLHPACIDLWQRPLMSFSENSSVWYCNAALGKNTLGALMPAISKQAGLSQIYTNHSIRATSITLMDEAGLEARHIMRVSGHKSETSIRSYAGRLTEEKKQEISGKLTRALSHKRIHNEDQEKGNAVQPAPKKGKRKTVPSSAAGSARQLEGNGTTLPVNTPGREEPAIGVATTVNQEVADASTRFTHRPLIHRNEQTVARHSRMISIQEEESWDDDVTDQELVQAADSVNVAPVFAPTFTNCNNCTITINITPK